MEFQVDRIARIDLACRERLGENQRRARAFRTGHLQLRTDGRARDRITVQLVGPTCNRKGVGPSARTPGDRRIDIKGTAATRRHIHPGHIQGAICTEQDRT